MRDATARVQLPLLVLGGVGLALAAFLRHAPNRLLSGTPVGLTAAVRLAGALPALALAVAVLLLAAPSLAPGRGWARWLGLAGAGGTLGAAGWLAGLAAARLAGGAARTAFGGGCWILLAVVLLLAADTARRLRPGALAAAAAVVLVLGPLAGLLGAGQLGQLALLREYAAQRDAFQAALGRHVLIVGVALLPTLLLGLPLGVAAQRHAALRRVVLPLLALVQTIPSIALFGLLIGPLAALAAAWPLLARAGIGGIGLAPAVLALFLYALLPVVRNTVEGLDGVPPAVLEAARGMGMTPAQLFRQVALPLALPVVLAGLRVTVVQSVGLAAVAALIGAGGLGAIMFQGLFANALDLVLLGAVPIILLAVLADLACRLLADAVAPRRA